MKHKKALPIVKKIFSLILSRKSHKKNMIDESVFKKMRVY